ncbi:acyltransferase family protein [Streptomyces lasalocidi]
MPSPGPRGGRTRLAAIDGLRLAAAVMVAAYHFLGTPTPHFWGRTELRDLAPFLHEISRYGWLGVEFFFAISGFVICMSGWGRTPAQFTVSRVARLFPAYWCALLLVVLLVLAARVGHWPAATRIDARTVLGNLTMVPGPLGLDPVDGVSWTLWVEARFYLLMALLLVFGLTYRRVVAFCGAWLLAGVVSLELHSPLVDEFVLPGTPASSSPESCSTSCTGSDRTSCCGCCWVSPGPTNSPCSHSGWPITPPLPPASTGPPGPCARSCSRPASACWHWPVSDR